MEQLIVLEIRDWSDGRSMDMCIHGDMLKSINTYVVYY